MKKIFFILTILVSSNIHSYELDEIYYFPKEDRSVLKINISLKEFEIEYEESSVEIGGNDIQEFDQQALVFNPIFKYSISDSFLIEAGFKYQGNNHDTYFEDINDNVVPASSESGFFDPRIQLRYRFMKHNSVFIDGLVDQIFKTNTYIEGNRTRSAKPYSGQHSTKLASEMGFKFEKLMLLTHLNIAFHSKIEKQLVILEDLLKADYTYSVGFGGTVLVRASKNYNVSASFTSVSVNAYDLKSSLNKVHVDKVLKAIIGGKVEYKGFETGVGRISLSFHADTTKNRLTYNDTNDIISETQALVTTLGIEKRF